MINVYICSNSCCLILLLCCDKQHQYRPKHTHLSFPCDFLHSYLHPFHADLSSKILTVDKLTSCTMMLLFTSSILIIKLRRSFTTDLTQNYGFCFNYWQSSQNRYLRNTKVHARAWTLALKLHFTFMSNMSIQRWRAMPQMLGNRKCFVTLYVKLNKLKNWCYLN